MMVRSILTLVILFLALGSNVNAQSANSIQPDVLFYKANLEPDLERKSIHGDVAIKFLLDHRSDTVVFNSGSLHVTSVEGDFVKSFIQRDNRLIISLSHTTTDENLVQIFYEGKPARGLFFPEQGQAYTTYSTSEWMICNELPNDRATFQVDLLVPPDKKCIASGVLVKKENIGKNTLYSWSQEYEKPAYTYGFAIGDFNSFNGKYGAISVNYYSKQYKSSDLETIFSKTGSMIGFFEDRSGVPYVQNTYSQILIGSHYQEMSGFSVLKNSYGDLVLKDSTETNLISHELAHQWWGNSITCESWNHFWLNEGMATFMSAAYNEYRFGKQKYDADIDAYRKVYDELKARGKDRSLVFNNWTKPTADDRNIVYFKGAYVLHLLRQEIGEEKFWKSIKLYSQKYFGKSVNTQQFQKSIEETAGIKLDEFFYRWVYGGGG